MAVRFVHGLNVIRGKNESGKSTLIEACLYALYGAKALRTPLSETVTWGRKETDLKVHLSIDISGVVYNFSRSKSGAECQWLPHSMVTGQAEVTKFAAELLGADAKTAGNLMLASQSGLRGSLDEGPSAVSGLMGKLASFDLIDQLIEAGSQTLLLGAEEPIRAKIAGAEAEVEAARASAPTPEETWGAKFSLDRAAEASTLAQTVADTLRVGVADADEAVVDARARAAAHYNASLALANAQQTLDAERSSLDRAKVQAAARPEPASLQGLRARVQGMGQHQKVIDAYRVFQSLPSYPESFWEGDETSFTLDHAHAFEKRENLAGVVSKLEADVRTLKGQKITSGKCPTCGLSAMTDEHVVEINAKIDEKLTNEIPKLQSFVHKCDKQKQVLKNFESVEKAARAYVKAWSPLSSYLNIDTGFYPPRVSWKGEAPVEQSLAQARSELDSLEVRERFGLQAEGRVAAHSAAISTYSAQIEKLAATLAVLPPVDIEPYTVAYDKVYAEYSEAAAAARASEESLLSAKQGLADTNSRFEDAVRRQSVAEARIAEYTQDLKTQAFNNVLMKKLKGMKPLITDHLWNKVLSAVSSFFSTLRGEASVVTKNGDGFKVNGRVVESLSGSTLDILALAIRVSLTKTFIPHASFLCLDEPSQGCDIDRTNSLLGFLASVGVDQTIIASHDILSESVADNVILLGV